MSLYLKGSKGKLDKVFSLYIRTKSNFTCERCGKKYTPPTNAIHCAHIEGRRKQSTRWNEKNCISACYGCHFYIDTHPLEKIQWYIDKFGQAQYDQLREASNAIVKYTESDIKALIAYYKQKIGGVKDETI